jgi:hypothetical protein
MKSFIYWFRHFLLTLLGQFAKPFKRQFTQPNFMDIQLPNPMLFFTFKASNAENAKRRLATILTS